MTRKKRTRRVTPPDGLMHVHGQVRVVDPGDGRLLLDVATLEGPGWLEVPSEARSWLADVFAGRLEGQEVIG